jgi:hypothetical protein
MGYRGFSTPQYFMPASRSTMHCLLDLNPCSTDQQQHVNGGQFILLSAIKHSNPVMKLTYCIYKYMGEELKLTLSELYGI